MVHAAGHIDHDYGLAGKLDLLGQCGLESLVERRLELRSGSRSGNVAEREDAMCAALPSHDCLPHQVLVDTSHHHVAEVPQQGEIAELALTKQALERLLLVGATGERDLPGVWRLQGPVLDALPQRRLLGVLRKSAGPGGERREA